MTTMISITSPSTSRFWRLPWFAGNSIDQLPRSLLSSLENLEHLDLADNQLSSIQALPLPRWEVYIRN